MPRIRLSLPIALLALGAPAAFAQSKLADSTLVRALTFRSIGPAVMSGRIADVAVTDARDARAHIGNIIYAGAATGGVWKSTNAGVTWTPVFDSVRTGSVGAVAVAPSDPDIVWVGTGESNNMRSSSWGTGVYKSTDGGKTWSGAMLPKSQHIGRIIIDPRDPNIVYVAALGPLWTSGGERGLYKTTDGGKTWTNTKEISKYTGFGEIAMDPSNPDVLYAASEERERREYGFLPAGTEAGIYKTTDGAKTWTKLGKGLPTGEIGRVGMSVCKSRPNTVYAMISAKAPTNGLYRSDDAGASWQHVNDQNGTAWYYSQVRCDPTDPDHVFTLNAQSRESHDGGKTFVPFAQGNGVHSDHHALWINDDNPEQLVLGTDGGLYMSWDAGHTWDHIESIVAGQFYAIAVDDALPFYNVYGGLQDNQTWGGPSRTRNSFGPTNADWFRMAGGDGFYAVPDPLDHQLVYAESQTGGVVRYDERTGQTKNIRPAPKPGERLRYNWSAPILPSKHDAKTVYMAANFLFKSTDRGDSWERLGGDLTRGIDRNKLPLRGGVPDSTALGRNEGTAEFGNITTIDESPIHAGLLAVGTDDGLIQVTRDGGKTWTKTETFPSVPETTYVSRVAWSSSSEGTLYATFDGHRSNDFAPYVAKSTDYGKSWTSIAADLPSGGSVQVIREHPRQPNLLFVGTEFGVYTSLDGGGHWTQLKSGLPGVPVDDIQIQTRTNDLVLGTHGRGIYILDDITPLEYLAKAKTAQVAYVFPVEDALLFQPNNSRNSGMGSRGFSGQNPEPGPHISYLLKDVPANAKVSLAIVDGAGTTVRELPASKQDGLYRVTWDMRVGPPLTGPVDTATLNGSGRGGRGGGRAGGGAAGGGGGFGGRGNDNTFPASPGRYLARLTVAPQGGGAPTVLDQPFGLVKDPMVTLSDAELKQLYAFRLSVVKLQHDLRERQAQVDTAQRLLAAAKRAADSSGSKMSPELKTQLASVEKELADVTREIGTVPAGRGGGGG
ncbi:MAG: WD40/YVTN/BNR-like repeat-containing protein, partial [Gemmatimonadales bacterium]